MDTSTTDYHNTLRIADEAIKKGISSLEAPVSNLSHMGADFANTSIYVVYEECFDLGTGMGLSKVLLEEVILWCVGTCWVTDNYEQYQPEAGILKKMAAIETNLKLMTTKRILSMTF